MAQVLEFLTDNIIVLFVLLTSLVWYLFLRIAMSRLLRGQATALVHAHLKGVVDGAEKVLALLEKACKERGGTLNGLIEEAYHTTVTPDMVVRIRNAANDILEEGRRVLVDTKAADLEHRLKGLEDAKTRN